MLIFGPYLLVTVISDSYTCVSFVQVGAGTSKKNRPTSGFSQYSFNYFDWIDCFYSEEVRLVYVVIWFVGSPFNICYAANANALKLSCELLRNFVTGLLKIFVA